MMKRPRSFIPTLLIFYCLATVSFGLTTHARRAEAGAMPRVMDPRAGDPNEPDPGFYQPSVTTPAEPPEELLSPNESPSIENWTRPTFLLTAFRSLWTWLLRSGKEGR